MFSRGIFTNTSGEKGPAYIILGLKNAQNNKREVMYFSPPFFLFLPFLPLSFVPFCSQNWVLRQEVSKNDLWSYELFDKTDLICLLAVTLSWSGALR